MKAYSLVITVIICCICRYASVEIKPELKKNILNFGYGIDFKYEGMLVHSFDRFYVVTKLFYLPSMIYNFPQLIFMKHVIIYKGKMDEVSLLDNIFLIL